MYGFVGPVLIQGSPVLLTYEFEVITAAESLPDSQPESAPNVRVKNAS